MILAVVIILGAIAAATVTALVADYIAPDPVADVDPTTVDPVAELDQAARAIGDARTLVDLYRETGAVELGVDAERSAWRALIHIEHALAALVDRRR